MDLRRALGRFGAVVVVTSLAACSNDGPTAFSDSAVILPATLLEALPLADKVAADWSPKAYLAGLGGGFAVADENGRSQNQSYVYYARFGPSSLRKLSIDFINGAPWTLESVVGAAPLPFKSLDFEDSSVAIRSCRELAATLGIPPAQYYTARLLSVAVWPEPGSPAGPPNALAWRVDFLELADGPSQTPIWWSLARFYVDPWTGQFLGNPGTDNPIVSREIYPNLNPLP